MARRFRSNRNAGPKRLTDWIGGVQSTPVNENDLSGSTVEIVSSFDTRTSGQSPNAPFTIVRVRGILQVVSSGATASNFAIGALGICVVNGEAFDAGVASIISPWTEAFDDRWLLHQYFSTMYEPGVTGTDGGVFVGGGTYRVEFDNKAMRKVEFGDVIVTIIENASTDSIRFFENHRTLVKLA